MGKKEDRTLEKLHNHLLSEDYRQDGEISVRNTDRTDVDMEEYTRAVDTPPGKSHRGWLVLMLLLAAVTGYLIWRYL